MAVFKEKITILQGSTFRAHWVWKAGEPLTPVDLTGVFARLQIRADIDSPDVLVELTTENGGITLGGASGEIDLYMPHSNTAAVDWDEGVFDLEFVMSNGDVVRKIAGPVVVSKEVTR